MQFVNRLKREEITRFYRGLCGRKDIIFISKPTVIDENTIEVKFGIKRGCSHYKPFRMVRFNDFSICEYNYNIQTKKFDRAVVSDSNNNKWRIFLTEKFGEEYSQAYKNICKT